MYVMWSRHLVFSFSITELQYFNNIRVRIIYERERTDKNERKTNTSICMYVNLE